MAYSKYKAGGTELAREKNAAARVSDEEYALLTRQAAEEKLTMSDFIRLRLGLGKREPKQRQTVPGAPKTRVDREREEARRAARLASR